MIEGIGLPEGFKFISLKDKIIHLCSDECYEKLKNNIKLNKEK